MGTDTTQATGAVEAIPDFLDRANRLRPILENHAVEADATGRLADAVVEAFHDMELFRIWLPRSLGGFEQSPLEMLKVIDALSYADGSAGWVAHAAALATTTAAAYCGKDAVSDIFGGERSPFIQGQGSPRGIAEVTDGGYILSGTWSYGSGVKHATHIYSGALIKENGRPRIGGHDRPDILVTVVPRDQVAFGENWDVVGLRGTGSIDYSIDGVFVPADYAHPTRIRFSARGGPLYQLGLMGFGCCLHSAFAIGVARRALDELRLYASVRGDKAQSDSFLQRSAQAEAKFRAARAFVYEVWRDVEATFDRGDDLSVSQQSSMRLAVNHATYTGAEVCDYVYRASGGVGLRAGPIQRCFRDVNASTQHLIVSDPILTAVGRDILNLAEGHVWHHHELIDVLDRETRSPTC